MGLNLGPTPESDDAEPILDINTTPLIDVMLVLLVMLIITIPIQFNAVNLHMTAGASSIEHQPEVVTINIDENNVVHWNGLPLTSHAELQAHMNAAAAQPTQPEIHVRPHNLAKYDKVVEVMASASRSGLLKLGLVDAESSDTQ